jgi:hypothetical protein
MKLKLLNGRFLDKYTDLNNKPLNRHKALQNLSREHHEGLVFVLRLQKGLAKRAALKSMDAYCDWFWEYHLQPHFEMEEEHLFPKYGLHKKLIKKAINQHQNLKVFFLLSLNLMRISKRYTTY